MQKKTLILGTIFAYLAEIWIPKVFFICVSFSGCLSYDCRQKFSYDCRQSKYSLLIDNILIF